MLDTADLFTLRRLVLAFLPLLAPIIAAVITYARHKDGWAALIDGLSGEFTALWMWAQSSPLRTSLPGPTPMPPISLDGEPVKTEDIMSATSDKATLVLILIFTATLIAMFAPSLADAQPLATKTATVAPSRLVIGPSSIVNVAAYRLNGEAKALSLGVGFGAHLDVDVLGLPVRFGAYGAPEVQLGDGSQFSLALLTFVGTTKLISVPVGGGIGWSAFAVGGPDPGLHDLHRRHLFVYGSLGLPLFEGDQ